MKVKELIEKLQNYPQNSEIVFRDSEHGLCEIDELHIDRDNYVIIE